MRVNVPAPLKVHRYPPPAQSIAASRAAPRTAAPPSPIGALMLLAAPAEGEAASACPRRTVVGSPLCINITPRGRRVPTGTGDSLGGCGGLGLERNHGGGENSAVEVERGVCRAGHPDLVGLGGRRRSLAACHGGGGAAEIRRAVRISARDGIESIGSKRRQVAGRHGGRGQGHGAANGSSGAAGDSDRAVRQRPGHLDILSLGVVHAVGRAGEDGHFDVGGAAGHLKVGVLSWRDRGLGRQLGIVQTHRSGKGHVPWRAQVRQQR